MSNEKRNTATMLMKCQNLRGGRIIYQDIKSPEKEKWGCGLECMQVALNLEKKVNENLLEMHKLASSHKDPILCDMLEDDYLRKQVHSIRRLGKFTTQLKRVGSGLGEFTFDHEVLQDFEPGVARKANNQQIVTKLNEDTQK
ncbi:DgyrCDS5090 [Dimorphilus gyrociliatus]|nr:DgyrCDS5090 [Dimorphilus gyrociliatus]